MRKYRKIILSIVSIIPLKVFLHFLFSFGEMKRVCIKGCGGRVYTGSREAREREYEYISSSSINNSIDVVFNEGLWIYGLIICIILFVFWYFKPNQT